MFVLAVKLGEPFGVDKAILDAFDWRIAAARVENDIQSDFIFAPHLRVIFRHNSDGLIDILKSKLNSGKYTPGSPMTIEVPKSSRVVIKSTPQRPGPNYSRPGSILMPLDRLFYQFLSDNCTSIVEERTDSTRSFSHWFDKEKPERLFRQTRDCWTNFQSAMQKYAAENEVKYILKIDIANFFGTINQHTLVNMLVDFGLAKTIAERLEIVLTSFTNSRSSRGLIQGVFPSDTLGNFYLEPIDRFLSDLRVPSARYVDDVYIFLDSAQSADYLMKALIPHLRSLDLALNEAKSSLFPKSRLMVEEPDLEELFQNAVEEVRRQIGDADFEVSYGFQSDWSDDEEDNEEVEVELEATKLLFDSINQYRGHEEEIERFCIPLFLKGSSDYAVDYVLASFSSRPSMCQIYCAYLAKFVEDEKVHKFLIDLLSDQQLYEWQLMWVLGALLQRKVKYTDDVVRTALTIFNDGKRHEAVRAIAAIFVGAHGDIVRRRALAGACATVTEYVQAAIYFVSKNWKDADGANFHAQWGNRTELNALISAAWMKGAPKKKAT